MIDKLRNFGFSKIDQNQKVHNLGNGLNSSNDCNKLEFLENGIDNYPENEQKPVFYEHDISENIMNNISSNVNSYSTPVLTGKLSSYKFHSDSDYDNIAAINKKLASYQDTPSNTLEN